MAVSSTLELETRHLILNLTVYIEDYKFVYDNIYAYHGSALLSE